MSSVIKILKQEKKQNKYMTIEKFYIKFSSNLKAINIIDTKMMSKNIYIVTIQSNLNQMFYDSLVSTIPKIWKISQKHSPIISTEWGMK